MMDPTVSNLKTALRRLVYFVFNSCDGTRAVAGFEAT